MKRLVGQEMLTFAIGGIANLRDRGGVENERSSSSGSRSSSYEGRVCLATSASMMADAG